MLAPHAVYILPSGPVGTERVGYDVPRVRILLGGGTNDSLFFEQQGMHLVNVECLPLHHGQLRTFVYRKGHDEVQRSMSEILATKHSKEIHQFQTYKHLAQNALRIKEGLPRTIKDSLAQDKCTVGYAAPAKANTLLNFLGI